MDSFLHNRDLRHEKVIQSKFRYGKIYSFLKQPFKVKNISISNGTSTFPYC